MLRLVFFGSLWSNEIDVNEINGELYLFSVKKAVTPRLLRAAKKKSKKRRRGVTAFFFAALRIGEESHSSPLLRAAKKKAKRKRGKIDDHSSVFCECL
jgi:hypothetical protein